MSSLAVDASVVVHSSLVDRSTTRCYTDAQIGPDIESQERRDAGSRCSYVTKEERGMNEQRIEAHGVNLHNYNTGRSMKFKKPTITENIANPERAIVKQRINTEKRKREKNTRSSVRGSS